LGLSIGLTQLPNKSPFSEKEPSSIIKYANSLLFATVISLNVNDRVTKALPEGEGRTPAEKVQARNFFKRNKGAARKWYEDRTGQIYPKNITHDEHPRPIKDGGDPLFIEPGFGGPAAPHGEDFKRWGRMGGRPRKP
jgi:hypothetical protein